ncbi:MAG TPA: hypothetical protein VNZ03_01245 [Terriglobales bacterium]|jgi:hypothetical protein|nr:hypothetical protein [Terriglobales bacterium]
MTIPLPEEDHSLSISMLRLTAEHLKQIKFPQLVRPAVGPNAPPTVELLQWAIQAYCFPWIDELLKLGNERQIKGAIVKLLEAIADQHEGKA